MSFLKAFFYRTPEEFQETQRTGFSPTSSLLFRMNWRPIDEKMLEVFDNDSIRRILHKRRRGCVPNTELRHRLRLTSIPAQFVLRRLRWFVHAARRPEGELIKDQILPKPPRTYRRRT